MEVKDLNSGQSHKPNQKDKPKLLLPSALHRIVAAQPQPNSITTQFRGDNILGCTTPPNPTHPPQPPPMKL